MDEEVVEVEVVEDELKVVVVEVDEEVEVEVEVEVEDEVVEEVASSLFLTAIITIPLSAVGVSWLSALSKVALPVTSPQVLEA